MKCLGRALRIFNGIPGILLLLCSLAFAMGCSCERVDLYVSSDTVVYDPDNHDVTSHLPTDSDESDTEELTDTAGAPDTTDEFETTELPDTEETSDISETSDSEEESDNIEDIVYWVSGGEVWHIKRDCPSLSRSKDILSGTMNDALQEGKSRVCKRCSG